MSHHQHWRSRSAAIITATSSSALVVASAGFGTVYAWTSGNHHGPVLGGLSVLMALGLEGAKPFAVEGAFSALRSCSLGRALALAALGGVAVLYSLTAELSLMADLRADVSAKRAQASAAVGTLKARYAAAQRELDALPVTRPVATLAAEVARLKTTRGLASCEDTAAPGYGPITRGVCSKIAKLTAEAAMTARRDKLQMVLRDAERALAASPLATKADPAASVLSALLSALGVPNDAGTVSEWLSLVPVAALEIGSALAAVLARGTPAQQPAAPERSAAVSEAAQTVPKADPTVPAKGLGDALVAHLKAHGGRLRGGQRGLAKALGTSTTALHRTIHGLAAAGTIALTTAPSGTELRLVS